MSHSLNALILIIFLAVIAQLQTEPTPAEYNVYLPYIAKSDVANDVRNFKFSFAGTDLPELIEPMLPDAMPERFKIDPYLWNFVPNDKTTSQMIRACHERPRQGYCWDRDEQQLVTLPDVPPLAEWVADHPGHVWLIGNEPDNFDLEAGDGLHPDSYGRFYATVASTIKTADPTATLVFCQTTVPYKITWDIEQFPHNSGTDYCGSAYYTMKELLPANVKTADIIDVISTHLYQIDASETNIDAGFTQWQAKLDNFAHWVNTLDNGALQNKPLYLTEFGILNNDCPDTTQLRPNIDDQGGVPCTQGEPFYGRNHQEGFWGIQTKTFSYFLSAENTQWEAAWWFYYGCLDQMLVHGGLFVDCEGDPVITRTGITFRDTMSCLLQNVNCPQRE